MRYTNVKVWLGGDSLLKAAVLEVLARDYTEHRKYKTHCMSDATCVYITHDGSWYWGAATAQKQGPYAESARVEIPAFDLLDRITNREQLINTKIWVGKSETEMRRVQEAILKLTRWGDGGTLPGHLNATTLLFSMSGCMVFAEHYSKEQFVKQYPALRTIFAEQLFPRTTSPTTQYNNEQDNSNVLTGHPLADAGTTGRRYLEAPREDCTLAVSQRLSGHRIEIVAGEAILAGPVLKGTILTLRGDAEGELHQEPGDRSGTGPRAGEKTFPGGMPRHSRSMIWLSRKTSNGTSPDTQ